MDSTELSVVACLPATLFLGSEGNSAKDFSGASAANGGEMAQAILSRRQGCIAETIGDFHQFVRVSSCVAVGADGRGDGEDGDGSVVVMPVR